MGGLSIVSVLSYLFAIECCNKYGARPLFCSLIATVLPLILNTLIIYVITGDLQSSIEQALTQIGIIAIIFQFAVSLFVFTKLRDTDSIPALLGWSAAGMLLIVCIIPLVL